MTFLLGDQTKLIHDLLFWQRFQPWKKERLCLRPKKGSYNLLICAIMDSAYVDILLWILLWYVLTAVTVIWVPLCFVYPHTHITRDMSIPRNMAVVFCVSPKNHPSYIPSSLVIQDSRLMNEFCRKQNWRKILIYCKSLYSLRYKFTMDAIKYGNMLEYVKHQVYQLKVHMKEFWFFH